MTAEEKNRQQAMYEALVNIVDAMEKISKKVNDLENKIEGKRLPEGTKVPEGMKIPDEYKGMFPED